MAHTYTKKGNRLYRYYICTTAQKQGRDTCATPSLPAQDIEDFVVEQIRQLANDRAMVEQVYAEAEKQWKAQVRRLKAEQKRLQRERQHKQERIRELAASIGQSDKPLTAFTSNLTELEAALAQIDGRLAQVGRELAGLQKDNINRDDLQTALAMFGPVWEELYMAEKSKVVNLLIKRIDFEAAREQAQITFRV